MYKTLITLIAIFFSFPAPAQELLGMEGDWKIYSITQDGKKLCYVASTSTKSSGTFKKRDEPYFLVTQKTKEQNEVSASSGFLYKKDADVHLTFNNKTKFRLFTEDNIGWARDSKTDTAIIEAMKKSPTMTLRGTSKRSTYAEDVYSLKGFAAALEKMKASCEN